MLQAGIRGVIIMSTPRLPGYIHTLTQSEARQIYDILSFLQLYERGV